MSMPAAKSSPNVGALTPLARPWHPSSPITLSTTVKDVRKRDGILAHVARVACFGFMYGITSVGLISSNKFLINKDRFPFALPLILLHSFFCSVLTSILYCIWPSLFPSLTDNFKRVTIDKDVIFKGATPIALLFSMQLVLSNTAYLHSSVAFLQMLKEGNLALVYLFSSMLALERFEWQNAGVLSFVVVATLLTIHGEMNFSPTGFFLQALSQVFECLKIVLQTVLLTQAGKALDALTYVMVVMPQCAAILSCGFLFLFVQGSGGLALLPAWADVLEWWPYLLVNAFLAFLLNVSVALVLKESSPVAFILIGIIKDACIVMVGGIVFHEIISVLQTVGFTLQLLLVLLWSMMQTFPEKFHDGIMFGVAHLVLGFKEEVVGGNTHRTDYGAVEAQHQDKPTNDNAVIKTSSLGQLDIALQKFVPESPVLPSLIRHQQEV